MSKKPIIGGIILVAIIGVVFVGAQINPDNPENEEVVFHVTLADPALYDENGVYVDNFVLEEEGWYEFRFVASGDSPHRLSIDLWQLDGRSTIDCNGFLCEHEYVGYSDVVIFRDDFDSEFYGTKVPTFDKIASANAFALCPFKAAVVETILEL